MGLALHIEAASLRFEGAARPVYEALQLELQPGGWTCLLGPSGCGKSSLLRQLAGLVEERHHSELRLRGIDAGRVASQVAWMGQQDLLYPWLSVLDNVCLARRLRGEPVDADYRERAAGLLDSLGLQGWHGHRPEALSGGMRQRVALARTLMQDKPLVLMDEPFSALDAVSRHQLQSLAAEQLAGRTVLLVTHDPQEALRLGHRIVRFCLDPARLEVLDCPPEAPPRALDRLGGAQQRLLDALGVAA